MHNIGNRRGENTPHINCLTYAQAATFWLNHRNVIKSASIHLLKKTLRLTVQRDYAKYNIFVLRTVAQILI